MKVALVSDLHANHQAAKVVFDRITEMAMRWQWRASDAGATMAGPRRAEDELLVYANRINDTVGYIIHELLVGFGIDTTKPPAEPSPAFLGTVPMCDDDEEGIDFDDL